MSIRVLGVCLLIAVLPALPVAGHPGSGLEVGPDGTVVFSDIFRRTIWRLAPDGTLSAAVTATWTHEFQFDAHGVLIFEREGDGDPAPQSLWRLTPDGQTHRLLPPTADRMLFGGTALAMDGDSAIFFAVVARGDENQWYAQVRRRELDDASGDRVTVYAGALAGVQANDGDRHRATFRMITDMRLHPDGSLWLLDRDRLRIISPDGLVSTRGPVLIDADPTDPPFRSGPSTTWNRLYGLAAARDGSAYVGYSAGRRVLRIAPSGEVDVAYRCEAGWSPVGVAVAANGGLVVSEVSDLGRKIRVVVPDSASAPSVLIEVGSDTHADPR